ncbi:Flp pilus assembly protein TadD [Sphaerotilus hippei]|uniref:Flp pilus assembly protein TadD n=1 Tax=Sphaerotilus hippei TaxID=744406 RepID=A0A318GX96_9BURK|nr:tetratricopeptide repeat protein [Sphaerotilus hippei]PXW94137.1 Flp pilus assembly protein TadD [Sphaerotilus hippei]
MPLSFRVPAVSRLLLVPLAAMTLCAAAPTRAAMPEGSGTPPPRVVNSTMDAELFYQLLVSESELRRGETGTAYQVMLDAARRTRDEGLFKRAVDIAIGGRAPTEAQAALKAWRLALPRSRMAVELQAQLLMALGKNREAQEPMQTLIELTPAADRPLLIASLPRLLRPGEPAKAGARTLDEVLRPWRAQGATRAGAETGSARAWLIAGDTGRSLELVRAALQSDPAFMPAAAVALELIDKEPQAEALVQAYVAQPQSNTALRMAWARVLTAGKRYPEALAVVRTVTRDEATLLRAWVMQGALEMELQQTDAASASLQRFLALDEQRPKDDDPGTQAEDTGTDAHQLVAQQDRSQALLMLAQAAEMQKDYAGAQRWLDRLAEVQDAPSVAVRRAGLLAKQGKLDEALAQIDTLPEGSDEELRGKLGARIQLLRDAQQWKRAHEALQQANERFPKDADLMYEQALLAEKLKRMDEFEALLRAVILLKPDQPHAYNALGYSLADRKLRLDEARLLVTRARTLAPDDAFITDSAGWVEFRLGNLIGAEHLLREAHARRPDAEIATHLGEVLWAMGRRDEARALWIEARRQDADNEVLTETLARLKVRL